MSRYTSHFPTIWKFSVLPFAVAGLAAPAGAMTDNLWQYLLIAALVMFGVNVIGLLLNMTPTMTLRKALSMFRTLIIGNRKLLSSPAMWRRKHGPWAILAILFSAFSNADYSVADSMLYEQQWSKSHVGMDVSDEIEAACDDCPINVALEQVVPALFRVSVDPELITEGKDFSFEGKKPWGEFFKDIVQQGGYSAELIRYNNMIVLTKAEKQSDIGVFYTNLSGSSSSFYESAEFLVNKGETLKHILDRWTGRYQWRAIIEDGVDMEINTDARFEGNLLEAVYKLVSALKARGYMASAVVDHSAVNKVIIISAKKEQ